MIEIKQKEPKLRFSDFDGVWKLKNIEELFDRVKNPVKVIGNQEYKQIGIRSHGKGIFYKEKVSGSSLGNKAVFWIEPNVFIVNIVFAWERAVAITSESEVGMIASHRFPMYKPKKELTSLEFILYFFKTQRGNKLLIDASPGGAGRNKTLGQKEFGIQKLYVPEYSEQKKIGSFFSKLDERILSEEKKLGLLQKQKKGYMQKIFNQELRFKDVYGNDYPIWVKETVSDLGDVVTGTTPSTKENKYYNNGIYPWVTPTDMRQKNIISTQKKLTEQGLRKGRMLPENTVLVTCIASIGKNAILKQKGSCNQQINAIVCNENHNYEFVYYLMEKNTAVLKSLAGKGTMDIVNKDVFSKMQVIVPCLEEQLKIGEFLSAIEGKIEDEQKIVNLLKKQKQGLMQQMFV